MLVVLSLEEPGRRLGYDSQEGRCHSWSRWCMVRGPAGGNGHSKALADGSTQAGRDMSLVVGAAEVLGERLGRPGDGGALGDPEAWSAVRDVG